MDDLVPGLYDLLIDELTHAKLASIGKEKLKSSTDSVDAADLSDRLGEVVASWTSNVLATIAAEKRPAMAIKLSEAVLEAIGAVVPDIVDNRHRLVDPIERLSAIEHLAPTGNPLSIRKPITPLRDTVLMTNARDQPSVGREIAAEIDSADRIDVVMAFIRWTGIRDLLQPLRKHVEAGRSLRIITTTYTGTTELRALESLSDLGAELRVSYDTSNTRLHAKAWLFYRSTGFSTVYIGSSNLSFSAQVTGLEWNVRGSQRTNPGLIDSFARTFETYWADDHFEAFDPTQFDEATVKRQEPDTIITPFAIEPYPFQRQMLERLSVDRLRGHPHNLIVAATGTGKTIVAALDYRRLSTSLPRARLLFVAHRAEILEQSQTMFRHVLHDGAFGELWVGGHHPTRWEHVFASVQSVSASDVSSIRPKQFDVVIIDEFHHAAAATYEALLNHLRPRHLLGLTATPERTDGLDILNWFGGRISVELRLWDALEQGLLSPFHYYGTFDGTDLSNVKWRRGIGYDAGEITKLYTADDIWASKVIKAVIEKVGDVRTMRALGFCVSINHAEFMASRFRKANIEALAITSNTDAAERSRALGSMRDGKVQILFTVDLFNEGIDIPIVDTVLMLRPTESATIFPQQLGRGLRRHADKNVLTVLDFVGHQNRKFRFDLRYRRLLGRTRRELVTDIIEGFPYLPAGCSLELESVAHTVVLNNIRRALPLKWNERVRELRELGDISLPSFLQETGLDLYDIYRGNHTWTEMRRRAGIEMSPESDGEAKIGRGIARILHIDDQERIDTFSTLLSRASPPVSGELPEWTRRQLEGLLLTLLSPHKGAYASVDDAIAALWRHNALRREILECLPLLEEQIQHLHHPAMDLHPIPLQIHASYTREEILAAFGVSRVESPLPLQAGVYWDDQTRTDLFFITLQKTEKDYSPTTRYKDYAISDTIFHWETQAATSVNSETGKRYLNHVRRGTSVLLFVRTTRTDTTTGRTMPYFCAGMAAYVKHNSERPIQITWQLHDRLPGDVFTAYRAAVA